MNATCSLLTPAGRGAVAVVEVAEADRESVVDGLFVAASGQQLARQPFDTIRFGRWGGEQGEEVVVVRRRQAVEIHCHGGRAASAAILANLVARGARNLTPQEWLIGREPSLIRRAAHQALQQATTQRVALILLDQYQGALEREVAQALDQLRHGRLEAAQARLQRLAETWHVGRWLTRPAKVVLTGAPNVGKSSLVNCLIGYQRTIVFDQPGTTRDVVTAETAIDGWPVVLGDTAGIRHATGELEQAGIALARQAATTADVVIEVVEAPQALISRENIPSVQTEPIQVANKADQMTPAEAAELRQQGYLLTSATRGEGIDHLLQAIAHKLAPFELTPAEGVLFGHREVDLVATASRAIARGEGERACLALESLLEEIPSES